MKIKITVISLVYNEEDRIADFLLGLKEFDQILLIDKSSPDKTVEIAQKFPNVRTYVIPYTDKPSTAFEPVLPDAKNEWIMHLTASDFLTNELKTTLKDLAEKEQNFDIVDIPYRTHVLGYWSERAPWHNGYARPICRKEKMFFKDTIHGEFDFRSDKIYQIPDDNRHCIHHLTHPNVAQLMERHVRYTMIEAEQKDPGTIDLKAERKKLRKLFFELIFKRKLPFLKKGGFELFLGFLSYYLLRYLFFSEKLNGKGADRYQADYYQKNRVD